jgi:uncharacterized Zn-finger protein
MRIELPLDSHGFLRRQCPYCEREFKWHHGPAGDIPDGAPDSDEYFCPYCGGGAESDAWWTEEQVETFQTAALNEVLPGLADSLQDAVSPMNRSGVVRATISYDAGNPPAPLVEPDDMVAVASPCHNYEPIKVSSEWNRPLHCLVCGAMFVVEIGARSD